MDCGGGSIKIYKHTALLRKLKQYTDNILHIMTVYTSLHSTFLTSTPDGRQWPVLEHLMAEKYIFYYEDKVYF